VSRDGTRSPRRRRPASERPSRSGPGGSGVHSLSALAAEASSLLGQADLRSSDMRWLRGELVDVMVSPLDERPSGDDAQILVTLVPRSEQGGSLAELTVDCSADDGPASSCCLGTDGQAVMRVAAGSYRLRVHAPFDLVPAAPAPARAAPIATSAARVITRSCSVRLTSCKTVGARATRSR